MRLLALAGVVLASLSLAGPPAQADKAQNTIRFAYDQAPESVDPFFNNVRIGVIIGQHVWDTLIYRDPKTGEYKGQLATAWKWVGIGNAVVTASKVETFDNGGVLAVM